MMIVTMLDCDLITARELKYESASLIIQYAAFYRQRQCYDMAGKL